MFGRCKHVWEFDSSRQFTYTDGGVKTECQISCDLCGKVRLPKVKGRWSAYQAREILRNKGWEL